MRKFLSSLALAGLFALAFAHSLAAQHIVEGSSEEISFLELETAVATSFAHNQERDSNHVEFSQADGYWVVVADTDWNNGRPFVYHNAIEHSGVTCSLMSKDIQCTVPLRWRKSGCCAVAENEEFKTSLFTYILERSFDGDLIVKKACDILDGAMKCYAAYVGSKELAAIVRNELLPPLTEFEREPIPDVEHMRIASFEVVASGHSRRGLLVNDDNIGPGFSGQGLKAGDLIVEATRLPPLRTFITEGPEDIVRLLVNLPEGGSVALRILSSQSDEETKLVLIHQSAANRLIAEQVAHARASRDFPESFVGDRLQLMVNGSFEALQTQLDEDTQHAWNELGPIGTLFKPFLEGTANALSNQYPYAGLLAAYALLRIETHGACGEPVTSMSQTTTFWTEFRNGLGQYHGRTEPVTSVESFIVPRGFGPAVEAAGGRDMSPKIIAELSELMPELACSSNLRKKLEANMLAFFYNEPPAHRN